MSELLKIGTRGTPLALAQTRIVIDALSKMFPDLKFVTHVIRTDEEPLSPSARMTLKGKAVFTCRIEEALLAGDVDLAVHSLKDLPTQPTDGLTIAAIPERADSRDALVSSKGERLKGLPNQARIGTSSPRRKAQLLAFNPGFLIEDMHGSIETRLKKLEILGYDGIILAAAGLVRLNLRNRITEFLPIQTMLPAAGQSALAVQVREGDSQITTIVEEIDHPPTRLATSAERLFSSALGGDCHVPLAAFAYIRNNLLTLKGLMATPDGRRIARQKLSGSPEEAENVGRILAGRFLQGEGMEILEATRSQ